MFVKNYHLTVSIALEAQPHFLMLVCVWWCISSWRRSGTLARCRVWRNSTCPAIPCASFQITGPKSWPSLETVQQRYINKTSALLILGPTVINAAPITEKERCQQTLAVTNSVLCIYLFLRKLLLLLIADFLANCVTCLFFFTVCLFVIRFFLTAR